MASSSTARSAMEMRESMTETRQEARQERPKSAQKTYQKKPYIVGQKAARPTSKVALQCLWRVF